MTQTPDLDVRQHVDQVLERHPTPWYVGDRSSPRSMFPIRDGNHKVVAYAYNHEVAQLIARLLRDAP